MTYSDKILDFKIEAAKVDPDIYYPKIYLLKKANENLPKQEIQNEIYETLIKINPCYSELVKMGFAEKPHIQIFNEQNYPFTIKNDSIKNVNIATISTD